jgi:hypothetical protein
MFIGKWIMDPYIHVKNEIAYAQLVTTIIF